LLRLPEKEWDAMGGNDLTSQEARAVVAATRPQDARWLEQKNRAAKEMLAKLRAQRGRP
jgi:hypothetical protein